MNLTDVSLRQRRLSCCVCLCTQRMPSDMDRTLNNQPRRKPLSTRVEKWIGGNEIQRGQVLQSRDSRTRLHACVRVSESDRETDAGQSAPPPAGHNIKWFNTESVCVPSPEWPPPPPPTQFTNTELWLQGLTLHNPNIICRRYMDVPLWLGDTGERDGGHTSKHRATRHSIDLCCHWIQDWLPSQHRCLTVISSTNVENKRYLGSRLSVLGNECIFYLGEVVIQ